MSFAAELSPCGSLSERARNPILGFDFMRCLHPHETISDAVSKAITFYRFPLGAIQASHALASRSRLTHMVERDTLWRRNDKELMGTFEVDLDEYV